MTVCRLIAAVMLISGFVYEPLLYANEFNYQAYLIGERASGMGGTGIADAYASDAGYINPGGLARARHDSVSFVATLYGFRRYRLKSAFSTGEDYTSDTFEIIPATAGTILTLTTNTVAGFSMFVTQERSTSEIQVHNDEQHYFNLSSTDREFWCGPGIGHRLNAKTMIGAAAYVTYRNFSQFDNYYLKDYNAALSYNRKFYDYGLLAMFGVRHAFTPRWRGGLVLQTPSKSLRGNGIIETHSVTASGDSSYSEDVYADDLEVNNKTPAKIGVGIAYRKEKTFACELDLAYHFAAGYDLISGDSERDIDAVHVERKQVLDLNLGCEYYIRRIYPVRCGFFTSYSSAPDPEVPEDNTTLASDPPHIDMYGFSLSVGKETETIAVNLGVNYVFGSGQAIGWKVTEDSELRQIITDADESHLYFFVTTSYLL